MKYKAECIIFCNKTAFLWFVCFKLHRYFTCQLYGTVCLTKQTSIQLPPPSFPQEDWRSVARQISLATHENASMRVSDKTGHPVENPPRIFISLMLSLLLTENFKVQYVCVFLYIWMCTGVCGHFSGRTGCPSWGSVTLNAISS